MRLGLLALVLAGCLYPTDEDCSPGPFWEGQTFETPQVGAAGDTLLVSWRMVDDEGSELTDDFTGVVIDGSLASSTLLDFGYYLRQILSSPDRVLVVGTMFATHGEIVSEIWLADGSVVATLPTTTIGGCAFDGDSFLVFGEGGLLRVGLDGAAIGSPIPLPEHESVDCVSTGGVTWLLFTTSDVEQPLLGMRVARGGGLLDATPRMIAVDTSSIRLAARANEAAMIRENYNGYTYAWTTLADDGTITTDVPLDITISDQPGLLAAEADGYFTMNNGGARRIAPDGTFGERFDVFEEGSSNTFRIVGITGANVVVQDEGPRHPTVPRMVAARVPHGGAPDVPVKLAEASSGHYYTRNCCSAGDPTGAATVLLVLLACRRRRRRRA